jgi:hypothetical protein
MRLAELLKYSIDEGARFDSAVTTKSLQKYCLNDGWPEEVVNNLSIVNNGSEHTIYYPPYLTPKVNELEYGTQSTPPTGTLRRFLDNMDESPYVAGMLGAIL